MFGETIPESWRTVLEPVLVSPEIRALDEWLRAEEEAGKAVYPPRGLRFRALELTPLDEVKVVILGQDPYHGPGQAMGLAFSVPHGVRPPPSLANIYKELASDCGIARGASGDLTGWARQGVLLLNSSLTVEAGRAASHARRGWQTVTDACIAAFTSRAAPTVFMLWGSHAQAQFERAVGAGTTSHCIFRTVHPSPLSAYRGFFGSKPFSRANNFLIEHDRSPVDWSE